MTEPFLPERLAPFACADDDARAAIVAWLRGRSLLAGSARRAQSAPLNALWLPFWLIDAYAVAHWEGAGKRGVVEMDFAALPVAADPSVDAALMEALEPWPARNLRPYDAEVAAQRPVGRALRTRDDALALARSRMERELMATARLGLPAKSRDRIRRVSAEYPREAATLALLPVWRVDVTRYGRPAAIVMNGATGKIAERPAAAGVR